MVGGSMEGAMNDLAIAFLERWVEEHVTPVPAGRQAAEAERLAAACIRDAAEEDITEDELTEIAIEDSDGDDLVAYMMKALDKAELEELDDLIGDDEEADTP
jgi:20S proteasome alpha/beta subunit